MKIEGQFQIGKAGVTPGVIEALALVLKTHKHVRISILRSSGRDKTSMNSMKDQLIENLSSLTKKTYAARIIGFTIVLRRTANHKNDAPSSLKT